MYKVFFSKRLEYYLLFKLLMFSALSTAGIHSEGVFVSPNLQAKLPPTPKLPAAVFVFVLSACMSWLSLAHL